MHFTGIKATPVISSGSSRYAEILSVVQNQPVAGWLW